MPDLQINGYKHHYEEVGDGTPMLYIGGTRFDSAEKWVPHMQENAAGFRMIMPDIRGMAGSEHTFDVTPEDWVKDLATFLDELGIDRVLLAAETLGTRIVTRFAYEHPERVRALILNGLIAYSDPSGDEDRIKAADPANLTPEAKARLEKYQGADYVDVNRFYVEMHAKHEFSSYYDLRTIAPSVQTPALILRGDIDDDRHPVAHSTDLHAALPDSWLAIYPNTGFNAMTSRPAEAWGLIREFVAAHE